MQAAGCRQLDVGSWMQAGRSEAVGAHLNRPLDFSVILVITSTASGVTRSNSFPAASCPAASSCAGHASSFRLRRRKQERI